jgi:hypothetical protein
VLAESFVDEQLFRGTAYKASGRQAVGLSAGSSAWRTIFIRFNPVDLINTGQRLPSRVQPNQLHCLSFMQGSQIISMSGNENVVFLPRSAPRFRAGISLMVE